ncbi:regulatory protein RecX [Prosthecochloris sp. ZM_2]|uniref:regulatory protein RecX n=1 Tax=Prosthecochloris sp. ZM_2 TaxID=2045206 RepID=UPI001F18C109|nr:regulatory protein RecX [Prosthecochloris sp. ZM_2]
MMERQPEEDPQKALDQAIRLLGIREHSRSEISRKLRRNRYSEELVETTLERLEELSLLDDLSFARNFVRSRTRRKPSGYYKLRYELLQKGVAEEIAEQALGDLDSEAQCESAALKKLALLQGDTALKRRKLQAHLQNRGFDATTIRETLERVLSSP